MTGPVLALDTATMRAVVAVSSPDEPGRVLRADAWTAGYRHGEELLARIAALLQAVGLPPADLGAVVAGTGPGAFTGLRVGLATAKGLAHAFSLPIVGVPTSAALLAAAALGDPPSPGTVDVLLLPAGPADRVLARPGEPARIVPGGTEPELEPGERLVAVDLTGRATTDAVARGELAREGLAAALLALGAARLAAGTADDLARLVPEYVSLPRGVRTRVPDDAVALEGRR